MKNVVIPAIASVRMFTGVGAVGVVISGRDYQTFIRVYLCSRLREVRKKQQPKAASDSGLVLVQPARSSPTSAGRFPSFDLLF